MHKALGLTLLELLIVILTISLMAAVGTANMPHLIAQQQSTASLNQIIGGVAFARRSAITLGVVTTFCPSDNLAAPSDGASTNIDGPAISSGCGPRDTWHKGSIIFQDRNGNGQLEANDTLLRRLPGWSHNATVAWRAFRARSYLQFTRRGFTNWQNGSFVYCPTIVGDTSISERNLRYARRLVLNQAGRSYRAYDRNGDGIDEGSRNTRLRC